MDCTLVETEMNTQHLQQIANAFADKGIFNMPAYSKVIAEVKVVDGEDGVTKVVSPKPGQKLAANIVLGDGKIIGTYPINEAATYRWYYKESPDTVLGTEPVYTVTDDNLTKTLCVEVNVDGYIGGPKTWAANSVTVGTITGVKVVGEDGVTEVSRPKPGQKFTANILTDNGVIGSYPVNPKATYKWYYEESPDTVLGTEPVYTVTSDNVGKTLCVEVNVDGYIGGPVTWTAEAKTDSGSSGGGGGGSVTTYAVNVEDTDNGTVTASVKSASKAAR